MPADVTVPAEWLDRMAALLAAAAAEDNARVSEIVADLVNCAADAHRMLLTVAILAGTPMAHQAGADGLVAIEHRGQGDPTGRPEYAAAQIVAAAANRQLDTAADLAALVVNTGEDHWVDVLGHVLGMFGAEARADLPKTAWAQVDWA